MKCPFCGGTESRVKDSRDIGDAIHRRRECEHCKGCEKRPLPAGEMENAAEEIEQELYRFGKQEIPSSVIGELVMDQLQRMDKIAYIRFASVYRSFGDVETMFEEIQKLLNREKPDATGSHQPDEL